MKGVLSLRADMFLLYVRTGHDWNTILSSISRGASGLPLNSSSICCKVFPLVSGRSIEITSKQYVRRPAYMQYVPCMPTLSTKPKKVFNTKKKEADIVAKLMLPPILLYSRGNTSPPITFGNGSMPVATVKNCRLINSAGIQTASLLPAEDRSQHVHEEYTKGLCQGDGGEKGSSVLWAGVLSDEDRSQRGEHADREALEYSSDNLGHRYLRVWYEQLRQQDGGVPDHAAVADDVAAHRCRHETLQEEQEGL
ncbi:hypothetical protein HW555_012210 [Spodoptera exigua]|uniref:Uncharacterized protein n=1 Tax=Spodoptera exigua TaxID=7107 RepID=A0A835KZ97_SPOEX|nr:hypothetical protein HW555_012210 [Spodoptera exigua]